MTSSVREILPHVWEYRGKGISLIQGLSRLLAYLVAGIPQKHLSDEECPVDNSSIAREEVDDRRTRDWASPDTSYFRRKREGEVEPQESCKNTVDTVQGCDTA